MIQPTSLQKPIVYLLALIKFLIPFLLIAPVFELQRDEFLYFQQGQHLALGYLENPPLLSYFGKISSLLGGAEWTVKLWPAFFGALTIIVACSITARLGGKVFAQLLTGIGLLTGTYLRIHILFQPNILDIFFWTCSLYFLLRFVQENNPRHLLYLTLCLSLGWWSKYSVAFLIIAIILAILFTQHRKIFVQKKTYWYLLTGLLLILPNIIWQYTHNWPLLHHMKELRETQLIYNSPKDFIIDQFIMLAPVMLLWITGLIWFFRKKEYRIFGWVFLFAMILLILGSGKSYYSLGVYPALLAAGAVVWEKWVMKRKWIAVVLLIMIIGLSLPIYPLGVPMMKPEKLNTYYLQNGFEKLGVLKWEDQRDHELPQDFADMLGWKEIAFKAEKFFSHLPDSVKEQTVIFGRHYGQAGCMIFYSKNKQFTERVFSDNGSFLLWIPEDFKFKNLILVASRMPRANDEVFQHFEKVTITDSVTNKISRQFGDKIFFFENIDPEGLQLAQDGLKEEKRKFKR